MHLGDCVIPVTRKKNLSFFPMLVQKYLLKGYLNALLLVNLKQFDSIGSKKSKIMYSWEDATHGS